MHHQAIDDRAHQGAVVIDELLGDVPVVFHLAVALIDFEYRRGQDMELVYANVHDRIFCGRRQ
jgi:hypothetical protein